MNLALVIVGVLLLIGSGVVFAQQARALTGTIIGAVGLLTAVTGWVMLDGGSTLAEALRTGGLAAAAVVALYALWLNDRRRKIDEERQDIERRRHDLESQRHTIEQARQQMESQRMQHDRERSTDERFARAIELLGNDADQVRVGALHALAGLARSRAEYTQTVLDVLCAYLRRPFDHAHYARLRGDEDVQESVDADRERQVRLTAQRLIGELLPEVGDGRAPMYDLDLTGATLEYFDISERVVGQITARSVNLYEANAFGNMEIFGDAWFTSAHSWGKFIASGTTFHKRAWFSNFEADQLVDLKQSKFDGVAKLAQATFEGKVVLRGTRFAQPIDLNHSSFRGGLDMSAAATTTADTYGMTVSLEMKNELPQGWIIDQKDDGTGLVRT
ncbi:pentapeptide repeat-containing protein [Kibdelosporangium persicum]|uniref:Pentapeptide repeat-containing protein n=1 Tax=Kibdelosporangium persicum TaxID=2698649 RepID=A0ABX2EXL9_9PSEU|nr:pentapeptide repeat-containing protein [Kibdelosporangium persicum]NRN63754.1 Pentapeptide repeat-containing protein [Kibdelosporangium persicum]